MVQEPSRRKRQRLIFVTLVILLTGVFLFSYSGRMESSDTRGMLDVMQSLYYQGDDLIARTAFYNYPLPDARGFYPLLPSLFEPMQLWSAMPLLWLADHVPWLGLAHTVWLFNIGVSAVLCGVLFVYALTLGYSEKVAVAVALLLGLSSIVWPYSKTFFREPLATLLILLTALCLERWRQSGYQKVAWAVGGLGAFGAAWLTKEAAILVVPVVILLLLPDGWLRRMYRLSSAVMVFLLVALLGFELFSLWVNSLNPTGSAPQVWVFYQQVAQWRGMYPGYLLDTQYIHMALHTYLLSVGASVWGTSPAVLMALMGGWMAWRQGQTRYVLVAVAVTLSFAIGYALLRGSSWFGGLGWPLRFLYPVVPIVLLAALPFLSRVLDRPSPKWMWFVLVGLAGYGVWIQIVAISLSWDHYGQILPPEANGFGEWGGGLNYLAHVRWVLIPRLWGSVPFDFAWVRMNLTAWPVVCAALVGGAGVVLWRLLHRPHPNGLGRWVVGLSIATLVGTLVGIAGLYRDPIYDGNRDSLHQMVTLMQAEAKAGDVVLLDREHYVPFFMNYGKFSTPRLVTLPDQATERYSPDQASAPVSANAELLVTRITASIIYNLAEQRDRLWLLSDASAWLTWRVRPVERLMAQQFYPLREISTEPVDPEVRLIEFSTEPIAPLYGRGAQATLDAQFGEHIRLIGYTVATESPLVAGDVLALTLYWQTDAPLDRLYTVAWFVVADDGSRVVQGADMQPGWGFMPTTAWIPLTLMADSHALRLPHDLAGGTYQIWVRMYETNAPEHVLVLSGQDRYDGQTALLPWRLTVAAKES